MNVMLTSEERDMLLRESEFEVGEWVTYYPLQGQHENLHFPAKVISVSKKRVTILYEAAGEPHVARVMRVRLLRQESLLDAP